MINRRWVAILPALLLLMVVLPIYPRTIPEVPTTTPVVTLAAPIKVITAPTPQLAIPIPINTYPAADAVAPLDSLIDPFGMDNRECVSYTAFKVQQAYGDMPNWTTYEPNPAPNANRWPALAVATGIRTGSVPRVGSVAIAMPGTTLSNGMAAAATGHAMWVEAINGDGTIHVSQYNVDETGTFSTGDVPAAGLIYIYFGG